MARALTGGMITEVTASILEPVLLLKMSFPSADINVWSGLGNKTFDGDVYQGIGDLGGVSALEETQLLQSSGMTFILSGIPSAFISVALAEDYQERLAKLWFGALDSSKELVSDPYLIFSGRMDVMTIDEGAETSTISLTVENRLVDLERPKLRRYTPEDQKQRFPEDLGLDFVPDMSSGKKVIWGT